MKRVGVYAGTFDPIHLGHVAFAEVALKKANLDQVVFLPERSPRHKHGATSYDQRLTMVEYAIQGRPGLRSLELTDTRFTVVKTLPELQEQYPDTTFVFLVGSDVFEFLPSWKDSKLLLATSELAIAIRGDSTDQNVLEVIQKWPVFPQVFTVITNPAYTGVSSTEVRRLLAAKQATLDIPSEVQNYIKIHGLYQ